MIYIFIVTTLLLAYFVSKRYGKTGCLFYGYTALIIGFINLFTIIIFFLISTVVKDVYAIPFGTNYTAKVVNSVAEDNEDGVMHTPIVSFTTESGRIITQELSFSSESLEKSYYVNYNEETGKLVVMGFILALKVVASILFGMIFIFAFSGVFRYALGRDMDGYYKMLEAFGLKFFLPFIMMVFDALLIYALFFGNEVPFLISGILVFFILLLTLGIFGYLKLIFKNKK